jgi:hypothetical protein
VKHLPPRWSFSGPNRSKSLGPSPGRKADVQEVPTVVTEFSPGLLGLCAVWHFHDKTLAILPFGQDISCKMRPKPSTELHSTMQNSHFTTLLKILPENPKTL